MTILSPHLNPVPLSGEDTNSMPQSGYDPAHHLIETEPYYEPVGDEIKLFEAAYRQQLPVLLKGPTGS
jgi:transcriptional regulator with AAA-type ATPase domain